MERLEKLVTSFIFWFVMVSIWMIVMHQVGEDPHSELIYLNPILKNMARSDTWSAWMDSGFKVPCKTLGEGRISIYWYSGSLITMALYGFIMDGCKVGIKKLFGLASKEGRMSDELYEFGLDLKEERLSEELHEFGLDSKEERLSDELYE